MTRPRAFLVLGATGGTGRRFVTRALANGHTVRALVRDPKKLNGVPRVVEVRRGSITEAVDTDALVDGVGAVVVMLGDRTAQRRAPINTAFIQRLVPSMRRRGVRRLFYQAGALSRPPGASLSPALWMMRQTVARSYNGQHEDNEAVMAYLASEAGDLEWIVHRAAIGSNGLSRGVLQRSARRLSVATFEDCAAYAYATVADASAVHTCSFSRYSTASA